MSMKDVSDFEVCRAYLDAEMLDRWPYELLVERTGQPEKVCYRACERADDRGLVDYGVSLRSGWLTPRGAALLAEHGIQVPPERVFDTVPSWVRPKKGKP